MRAPSSRRFGSRHRLEDISDRDLSGMKEAMVEHRLEQTSQVIGQLRDAERRVLERIARRETVARNVHEMHAQQMSFGERAADRLAQFAGSWRFIGIFFGLLIIWVCLNSVELIFKPWDPYPFILLNLFLSLLAGIQAPVIMMSQNRQEARDRLRAEQDYEVNLKAEMEIAQLHGKMDELRERQWQELLGIQERQINMLDEQINLVRQVVATVCALPRGEADSNPSSAP